MNKTILILGACGQIVSELTLALRQKYGNDSVVASDIRQPEHSELLNGPFEVLDASSARALRSVCEKHKIHTVYHLVAMLSATGEKFPMKAWDLNMQSLLHVLELAREKVIQKLFWPSSIAVFGPTTPKQNTPYCLATVVDIFGGCPGRIYVQMHRYTWGSGQHARRADANFWMHWWCRTTPLGCLAPHPYSEMSASLPLLLQRPGSEAAC